MKIITSLFFGLSLLATASVYAAPADEVITEDPAGEVKWYSSMSTAFSPSAWGFVNSARADGVARKVIFGEDGFVYFRDPISMFPTKTYIKGERQGNQIIVTIPQTIEVKTGKDGQEMVGTVGLLCGTTAWDPEYEYYRTTWEPTTRTTITFNCLPNGIIMQSEEDKDLRLNLFIDGVEMVYGDNDYFMTPVDPTVDAVRFPDNVEPEIWTLSFKKGARPVGYNVEAVRVGNELFIRKFWHEQPNATIKGQFEDGKLVITPGQYLGWIPKDGIDYFIYTVNFTPGHESLMEYYALSDEDLVFDVDEQTGTCTLEKGDVEGFIVKGGANVGYEVDKNQCFLLMKEPGFQKRIGSLAEPMAPEFINDKYRTFPEADIPFIRLEFAILPFDVKGNALDQENLRYSLWRDGEKMFVDPEELPNYENLPEATFELTLDFDNSWGMTHEDDNIFQHHVHIEGIDYDKYGIQTIFYDPETNERKASKIAYYYPATMQTVFEDELTNSVDEFASEEISDVVWFDLLGNRVCSDFKGICIKAVTYKSGAMKTTKVIR